MEQIPVGSDSNNKGLSSKKMLIILLFVTSLLYGVDALLNTGNNYLRFVEPLYWAIFFCSCVALLLREHRRQPGFYDVIRFTAVLIVLEFIILSAPWVYALNLTSNRSTIVGAIAVLILSSLIAALISSAGLFFTSMMTLQMRPRNLRPFIVRYILLTVVAAILSAISGVLCVAMLVVLSDWLLWVPNVLGGILSQLILSFLYYFVVVSFFDDVCPVRLPGSRSD